MFDFKGYMEVANKLGITCAFCLFLFSVLFIGYKNFVNDMRSTNAYFVEREERLNGHLNKLLDSMDGLNNTIDGFYLRLGAVSNSIE